MSSAVPMRSRVIPAASLIGAVVVIGIVAAWTHLPSRLGWTTTAVASERDDDHDHSGHDHAAPAHSEQDTIALSKQARKSLGLRVRTVSLSYFTEYIEVPGVVTDWPGRTHIVVTSPLTGVINAIHVSRGELIRSGAPLFSLRLTHQDLVKSQEQFLTQLGQLDVAEKEIARLRTITTSGAVAGKTLLAREYERDMLVAGVRAARQAMLLHGLSEPQIQRIETDRELVREITVYAPQLHADDSLHHDSLHDHPEDPSLPPGGPTPSSAPVPTVTRLATVTTQSPAESSHVHIEADLLVTMLDVSRGQSVEAGESMARLSDYSRILIEGHAFERDGAALRAAAESGASVQAVFESSVKPLVVNDLKVAYIGNEVSRQSRALPFYVELANEIERSESLRDQRFVSWQYKPGQRLKLRLPVKTYDNVIVVPKDAVGEEGLENYVFVDHGDHLDRLPVNLVARGPLQVAIANDGQLKPRQKIALNSAHQLLMALRNQAGGGIDPHAGHNH